MISSIILCTREIDASGAMVWSRKAIQFPLLSFSMNIVMRIHLPWQGHLMAIVTFIPQNCINILDLVPSTPSLASMLASSPMQRHRKNGGNTSKDQTKKLPSGQRVLSIASLIAACEKLLRFAGDTESKIRCRDNRNADYKVLTRQVDENVSLIQ